MIQKNFTKKDQIGQDCLIISTIKSSKNMVIFRRKSIILRRTHN